MVASSYPAPICGAEVNRTNWLPGIVKGHLWLASPGFNCVKTSGCPPDAETRHSPPVLLKATMMLFPSSLQPAPTPTGASHSVTAAPPSTAIFFILPSAKKPIQSLRGEKNGEWAFSVPARGSARHWPSKRV